MPVRRQCCLLTLLWPFETCKTTLYMAKHVPMQAARAVRHLLNRSLSCSIVAWKDFLLLRRHQKEIAVDAIRRLALGTLGRCLLTWREYAASRRDCQSMVLKIRSRHGMQVCVHSDCSYQCFDALDKALRPAAAEMETY